MSQTNEDSITFSLDFMSLGTEQSSYVYNPPYDSQMWSSLEVENPCCFFDILIYLPSQINFDMSLLIHPDYSSC